MQRHRPMRYLAIASLALTPSLVHAQAFGINEIGTCAASRGFAVTGSPCQDASNIFWNPGAAVGTKGWSFLGGVAAIMIDAKFTQDTTFREFDGDSPTALVPHFFVTWKPSSGPLHFSDKLTYGFGLYVPYGLTSQWKDDFPGRFQAKKASLATIYFQPNLTYEINSKWSVGAGPVIGVSHVELIQAIDLADQATTTPGVRFRNLGIPRRTEFARAQLEGEDTGFGVHVGVFGKLTNEWTVGLRWLSPVAFEYGGSEAKFTQVNTGIVLPPGNPICFPAGTNPICSGNPNATVAIDALVAPSFQAGGPLVDQEVFTEITHPAQIQAGFGYSGYKDWLLSFDYAWTGWKKFKELPVFFQGAASGSNRVLIEDYNNTSAFRVGAQRMFTNGASVRFGASGVASAAPDETVTPLLPEQDRAYLSLGGSYPFMSRFAIEGAYLRVMGAGKRGRIDERATRAVTAGQINSGVYDLSANVLSISLKANY